MQSPWEPPWTGGGDWSGQQQTGRPGHRRFARDTDLRMRISNAERNDIADTLSKHFAEGRLDSDEFDERVGKVMNAKTRGDLAGLLDDLPRLGPPPPQPRPRRPLGRWILVLVLVLLVASTLAVPPHVHVPWLLIGIVALVLWRKTRHRHRWQNSQRSDVASRGL